MALDKAQTPMTPATLRELATRVSRYFLEFLETDFKRQRAPRRRIRLRTDTGLLAGMSLRRYPKLIQEVWKVLERPAGEGLQLRIPRGRFQSPLSPLLRNLISQQVEAIEDAAFEQVQARTLEYAKSTHSAAIDHPEAWVEGVSEHLALALGEEIVHPLLAMLDGSVKEQAYSPIESAFELESDLISLLAEPVSTTFPPALNTFLVNGSLTSATKALAEYLDADDARRRLVKYFDAFGTADAYAELRDLVAYLRTGENLQFYLYCCRLSFANQQFPLYYIPGSITETENKAEYLIQFEPHLYVNKAAVDFIRQEKQSTNRVVGESPVKERILYLKEDECIKDYIARDVPGLSAALDIPAGLDFGNHLAQKVRTTALSLDNSLVFAGFDRSDEATLNVYEELLVQLRNGAEDVTLLFEDIVKGVIIDEPISVRRDVETALDDLSLSARLVVESPIPLNEEQRGIRQALQDPRCRFVVVEGPPGTGKSHTITALAFDAILQGKSTLILSDKMEALDVVEDKLDETMAAVRGDQDFQNPILRLGRQGANFKKLVSGASLNQIQAHHRAQRVHAPALAKEMDSLRARMDHDITATAHALGSLSTDRLFNHFAEERRLLDKYGEACVTALNRIARPGEQTNTLWSLITRVKETGTPNADQLPITNLPNVQELERELIRAVTAASLRQTAPMEGIRLFHPLSVEAAKQCLDLYYRFTALRRPVIGYLFRKRDIEAVEQALFDTGHLVGPVALKAQGADIYAALSYLLKANLTSPELASLHTWLCRDYPAEELDTARDLVTAWRVLAQSEESLTGLNGASVQESLARIREWGAYIGNYADIQSVFDGLPPLNYLGDKSKLELLCTSKMTGMVDGRFLDFTDNQKAKMRALAGVISARQKFPLDNFDALRSAFPVILAGIRDFAEYMPLKQGLFDLLIIDEGSQVSVAQALTAILRAKKVVVFGDTRQFSNVKSSFASIERNSAFRSDLTSYFRAHVAQDAARLQRLSKFDVKSSVLDFFGLCANYTTMLLKHFRGPQELISFSSKEFYSNSLQAIKIRTQPLEDTIRFDVVEPHPVGEPLKNVNRAEAAFILQKLELMLDDEDPPTVGIITPFNQQQSYLSSEVMKHPRGDDMESRLRLKIMTFDTCQGEQREVVFYSMVATKERDALNYVFPVSLADAANTIEDKLRMQRLNVGFSRSQETVWFVLSKPIEEYPGAAGVAIRHFHRVLTEYAGGDVADTDPRSPMEQRVLGWLNSTPFVQEHREHVDIQPQFPVGRYLKQLDPRYHHPLYKADFLVTVADGNDVARVIVEYDGFEYHFNTDAHVTADNYDMYLTDRDLERQLVIESYGYQFLRINRFNLGHEPVTTLSARLEAKVQAALSKPVSTAAGQVIESAEDLVNGNTKICSSCGNPKPIEDFYDHNLRKGQGGYGRKCRGCKQRSTRRSQRPFRRRRRRW